MRSGVFLVPKHPYEFQGGDTAVTRLQSEALSGLGPVELTAALRRLETLSRRLDAGVRGQRRLRVYRPQQL